jgi:hypothetical protein
MIQRGDIMGLWGISRIILLDDTESQGIQKYEKDNLAG